MDENLSICCMYVCIDGWMVVDRWKDRQVKLVCCMYMFIDTLTTASL